jgi:surface antigen
MPQVKFISIVMSLTLALAGCAAHGDHEDAGLAVGAITGGLIGSKIGRGSGNVAATVVGAVAGGIIGSQIGRDMDRYDRRLAEEAEYEALERGYSGRARVWRNDRNGHYGEVVPSRPYRRGGYDCRDYSHTIYIEGRPQTMRGTACRQPDGTWRSA